MFRVGLNTGYIGSVLAIWGYILGFDWWLDTRANLVFLQIFGKQEGWEEVEEEEGFVKLDLRQLLLL